MVGRVERGVPAITVHAQLATLEPTANQPDTHNLYVRTMGVIATNLDCTVDANFLLRFMKS